MTASHGSEIVLADRRSPAPLEAGRSALRRGAWADAAAAFAPAAKAASEPDETGAEAWAGIGLARYWLADVAAATYAFERAFRQYRDLGRKAAAARMALWLTDTHIALLGAHAVANGWIEQADRLLSDLPHCSEHAWLLAYRGHCALFIDGDAEQALALSREGQTLARDVGATDAEVVTRALEGLSLVQLGQVTAGMACLDEASADSVTRGLTDLNAVAWACCYLVTGCQCVRDLPRAEEWCKRVLAFCEEWGLTPVYASCRIEYATVLTWRGDWDTAEGELVPREEVAQSQLPGLQAHRQLRLAELRRRQGRLSEAEQLLHGAGEDPLAIAARGAVALDRNEFEIARDLGDRALRLLPADAWIDRIDALLVRARAAAALGDAAGAEADALELAETAARAGTPLLRATAAYARAIAAQAQEDPTVAVGYLETAVVQSARAGAPYETAQARLELATVLARSGRHQTALREAGLARDAFAALGAERDRARAEAFLRNPPGADDPRRSRFPLSRREIEVLRLVSHGWTNQHIADDLFLSHHTVKRHVANILRKLDAPSRTAAVARGTRLGLLP